MSDFLVFQQVSRIYRQGPHEVRALEGLDLTLGQGEFACVAGPSGSGKSTLLNLAGALDRPSRGTIFLAGREISRLSRREGALLRRHAIGFVFQQFNLVEVLTAAENIEYVLLLQGVAPPARRKRVAGLLEAVGLAGLGDRLPAELSGGQQQRVAVARALASSPALVLADEPTANLDSRSGMAVMELLRSINRSHGTTFLFSSHDPRIIGYADRVIHLVDGRLAKDGETA